MASKACDQHDSLSERSQCANEGCMFFAYASNACAAPAASVVGGRLSTCSNFCRNEATDGLCSQCYKVKMSTRVLTAEAAAPLKEAARPAPTPEPAQPAEPCVLKADTASPAASQATPVTDASPEKPKGKNRCYQCNKKVGLLGFECKCGRLLCAHHRQAEEHACTYDYRSEGKKKLEAANPRIAFQKVGDL
jgi:AN1-like Zinc finger/MARCKS family